MVNDDLPSGKRLHNLWTNTVSNGKAHYKRPFSVAMLDYQKVFVVQETLEFKGRVPLPFLTPVCLHALSRISSLSVRSL